MVEPIAAAIGAGVQNAISNSTARLVDQISLKFAKDRLDVLAFILNKGLPRYLEANYAKCGTLKTLLNRNHPAQIDDCFVAPDFKMQSKTITADVFMYEVNASNGKAIVTGLAGSGKSVFLKHAFRQVLEKGYSYYPIFYELRLLNRLPHKPASLKLALFESINECCHDFTRAQLNYGLKSGAFYFLLDGFDELSLEARDIVAEEICGISRNFPKCPIIVTSRPSDDFLSWEGFTEVDLLPFDLQKAATYISRLEFDAERKNEFIADLKAGLFEKNKDFLSNPLLSAMMLLTYDTFGEIPAKKHIFYAKCFEVLAREHDASKGRYKRELFSGVSVDDLEKVFMFFCAFSYVDRRISFSKDQMEQYVSKALAACGMDDADVDLVTRDFRESISIMELVGLQYEFAHRSFQEYFCAKFVICDREISLAEKIGLLASFFADDTIEMIADMDRSYFEDDFLLPLVKSYCGKFSKIDPNKNPAGILSRFFSEVRVYDRNAKRTGDDGKPIFKIGYLHHTGDSLIFFQQMFHAYGGVTVENAAATEPTFDDATHAETLASKYGGEIKIHHRNNMKLLEIGASEFASKIKNRLIALKAHLERRHLARRRSLSTLIRDRYSKRM